MDDYLITEEYPNEAPEYIYEAKDFCSPKVLLFIVLIFFLPHCLIPATKGTYVRIPFGLYLWWSELALLGFALIIGLIRFATNSLNRITNSTKKFVLIPFFLLGLWETISIIWNGQDTEHKIYSLIQPVMMFAGVFTAVMVISGLTYKARDYIVKRIAVVLTSILVIYMGLSFIFPSLRPSTEWVVRTEETLGFIRVFGPLGQSSVLAFVIFPLFGYCISKVYTPGCSKAFWLSITLFALICIIGTGSRGAALALGLFTVLFMMVFKFRSLLLLLPIGIILGIAIGHFGIPERYLIFEGNPRVETWKTGMRAFTSKPQAVIFGVGHGKIYTRRYARTKRFFLTKSLGRSLFSYDTEYGWTLHSTHNTFVRLLAETGLIGFFLYVTCLLWIFRRFLTRSPPGTKNTEIIQSRISLAGVVTTFFLMMTDVYLLFNTWLTFIWLIFAISACENIEEAKYSQLLEDTSYCSTIDSYDEKLRS